MSRRTKIWLIVATFLVLSGIIFFGGAMTMLKWDFTKLSSGKNQTNEYALADGFKNISIVTDTADIVFVPTQDKSLVVCNEKKNLNHSVSVKDGTLVIEVVDTRKWYEYISINFQKTNITVYIPAEQYGTLSVKSSTGDIEIPNDLSFESIDITGGTGHVRCNASTSARTKIKLTTGNISIKDISAGELDLTVTTGDMALSGVKCDGDVKINVSTGEAQLRDASCKNLFSEGTTGDMLMVNVVAKDKLSVERDTGDIEFEACDGGEIYLKTTTGDIEGSLLSEKIFIVSHTTGSVEVPRTLSGGRCEITTNTGDIEIDIKN